MYDVDSNEHINKVFPNISIAMAVYNGEQFLQEQVDSILRQTISNFELVICDDNSTDGSWAILQQYANSDSRIRLFRNEHNLGFIKNFEGAILLCKGNYIALSDQDDVWTENHLELLYKSIGNKSLVCGNALIVDKDLKSLNMTTRYQQGLDWIPQDDFNKAKSILFFRNPYFGCLTLFERSLVDRILPIPEGCNYHDSWIAFIACLNRGINYIDDIILYYRRTGENVTKLYNTRIHKYRVWRCCLIPEDREVFVSSAIKDNRMQLSSRKNSLQRYLFILRKIQALQKYDTFKRRINKLWCMLFLLKHYNSIYSVSINKRLLF